MKPKDIKNLKDLHVFISELHCRVSAIEDNSVVQMSETKSLLDSIIKKIKHNQKKKEK